MVEVVEVAVVVAEVVVLEVLAAEAAVGEVAAVAGGLASDCHWPRWSLLWCISPIQVFFNLEWIFTKYIKVDIDILIATVIIVTVMIVAISSVLTMIKPEASSLFFSGAAKGVPWRKSWLQAPQLALGHMLVIRSILIVMIINADDDDDDDDSRDVVVEL